MNIDEIKKISLVEFLNQLGYQPTRRDSKGLWFYAPYRSERKPSFHVNPNRQVWFDFGTGAGGDIFSLAGEMSGETDFLRQADYIAEKMRIPVAKPYKPTPFVEEPTFENVKVSRLTSPALLKYLADRGIPREIARRYCVQVDYQLHGKDYYAIGFENNAHGFELRNPFLKGLILQSISPILPTATPGAMSLRVSLTSFRLKGSASTTAWIRLCSTLSQMLQKP